MYSIFLQQSGKPVDQSSGNYWVVSGFALHTNQWKTLEVRLNGLQKNFLKANYDPLYSRIDSNDLLHPRNAEKAWTKAYVKGMEKIVASLDPKFFVLVVDKRTTDKPAHPKWLVPLSYNYLMKPILAFLRQEKSLGSIIIPPERDNEREVIAEIQSENMFGFSGRNSPLVCSPMMMSVTDTFGLQIAQFVANVTRRYQETIYPKLNAKETLYGYDSIINAHYQGFVKPNTFVARHSDEKGYRTRGFIYLWRKEVTGYQEQTDQSDQRDSSDLQEKVV